MQIQDLQFSIGNQNFPFNKTKILLLLRECYELG
jgi:hypothetical protein